MVTTVGTETDFIDTLNNLIELDYDAIEAYDAAIERIDDPEFRARLQEFRADHLRHTRDLAAVVTQLGGTPASGPGLKRILTKGKVLMADLMGDKAILTAMKTNEDDTNTAYERAAATGGPQTASQTALKAGLADERRHRAWIEQTLAKL